MIDLPVSSFFYLRHGKTVDNRDGIASGGERDTLLTDEGRAKADGLSDTFAALSDEISCIYCSPLTRARETADRVNAKAGKEIVIVPTLHEWLIGDWVGTRDADVSVPLSSWAADPPRGESREQLANRVLGALQECCRLHQGRDGAFLIVAHAGVWWGLTHALGMEKHPIDNCALFHVAKTGNLWHATHRAG